VKDRSDDCLAERTLSTRRIYEGRVLNLRVDEVQLPSGRHSTREVVEHRGAVAAVPLTAEDRVLLVRQWRYAVGECPLEIPAGTLEPGESAEECIDRELAEEVGYRARSIEPLLDMYVSPGYSDELIRLFLATDLIPRNAQADEDEELRVVEVPLAQALEMCHSGELRDGKTIACLLCAAARLGMQ